MSWDPLPGPQMGALRYLYNQGSWIDTVEADSWKSLIDGGLVTKKPHGVIQWKYRLTEEGERFVRACDGKET